MSEEGRGGGSELVSDLSLDLYPDPWKILRIRIRQNGADSHGEVQVLFIIQE